jgi:single-strand DNA-binding protein
MAIMTVTMRIGSEPVYKQVTTKKGVSNILDISGADVTERENSGESPWYRVTLWNKYADTMAQYLQKGTIVVVSGKLSTRAYQSKSGTLLVEKSIADAELSIVTGGKHNQQQPQPATPQTTPVAAPQAQPPVPQPTAPQAQPPVPQPTAPQAQPPVPQPAAPQTTPVAAQQPVPVAPQPQQVSPAPQATAAATTANSGFQPLTAEEIKDLPY